MVGPVPAATVGVGGNGEVPVTLTLGGGGKVGGGVKPPTVAAFSEVVGAKG